MAMNTKMDAKKSINESARDPNNETESVSAQPKYLMTIRVDETNKDAMEAALISGSLSDLFNNSFNP